MMVYNLIIFYGLILGWFFNKNCYVSINNSLINDFVYVILYAYELINCYKLVEI